MFPELTEEDVRYIGIYIRFILNYIPIFIPCLLGSLAIESVRKYHGSKDPPVSKKMILLSSAIVTFVVMAIDLVGVNSNLRNEGLSIIIGFIGGILSRGIISALAKDEFVSTMCKGFIDKNSGVQAFAYAFKQESSKDDDDTDDESEEDEDSDEESKKSSKENKKKK